MLIVHNSELKFIGNTSFENNNGTFVVTNGVVTFYETINFIKNSAKQYESIFLLTESNRLFLGIATFISNEGKQGGAISAYNSVLHFYTNAEAKFICNSADFGGAISIKRGAHIELSNDTKLFINNNTATTYGGGFFVEDEGLWITGTLSINCFVQSDQKSNRKIILEKNKAGITGMDLFGGWIDICLPIGASNFLAFYENYDNYTDISSNPSRVCMCFNSKPDTSKYHIYSELYPGQTFEVEAVAVGQRFGVVPAIVRANFKETDSKISVVDTPQQLQDVEIHCTTLSYTIHSSNQSETMLLTVDNKYVPQSSSLPELFQFEVFFFLNNCSIGFDFDSEKKVCIGHHLLIRQGIICNITSHTINRKSHQWINASLTGIIVHHHCLFDYCNPHDLSVNLSTPDDQCAFNRSGILCGACKPGLSQVLGTSYCKKRSSIWILLLVPISLVGIIGLVVGLMVLNFTVSTGTINGLLFYANIVRANTATFFPGQTANTLLSWFIAWLNLDLGIETCFYNGLNAYAKTWLQFVFPLYIWFMVTIIIVSSHYSTKAARICGNNAVQVLATLLLLSYAKLLRVTITIFQPTQLIFLEHYTRNVWPYDGNINYLDTNHVILFVAALLFLVLLFIPYTVILFGIQWLQHFSHYKVLFWVNKLKPLFDAYTCLLYTSDAADE